MLNFKRIITCSKMNRSQSTPADSRTCPSSEELKELFTDPAFRKKNDMKKTHSSSSIGSYVRSEDKASTPIVKVADTSFYSAEHHQMTRRITIAGGFLDIALFTANCEQLKFVLELGSFHIYYNHVLGLLITSLILQLLVGFTLFLLGCKVMHRVGDESYSNFLNHTTMGLVALITIVNIFIGTFGPKGTVIARCLGAFAYPNTSGPVWKSYINATRNYMASGNSV